MPPGSDNTLLSLHRWKRLENYFDAAAATAKYLHHPEKGIAQGRCSPPRTQGLARRRDWISVPTCTLSRFRPAGSDSMCPSNKADMITADGGC